MPSAPAASEVTLEKAGPDDLPALQELAREIWTRVYPEIISVAQIEFMLDRMYRPEVMLRELTRESIVYLKICISREMRGFAAFGPGDGPGEVLLHKLYLHPDFHGRGCGSRALELTEAIARSEAGARRMRLRVNKENNRALAAYQRNGYAILEPVCSDIGGGFVMDDFWMAKDLTRNSTS